MVSYTNYPLVLGLLNSGPVWFGFAWFGWCILLLSFVPLVWICFPGLDCRVATLLNPLLALCCASNLPTTTGLLQVLVHVGTCEGRLKVGYHVAKVICCGMWSSTVSTCQMVLSIHRFSVIW